MEAGVASRTGDLEVGCGVEMIFGDSVASSSESTTARGALPLRLRGLGVTTVSSCSDSTFESCSSSLSVWSGSWSEASCSEDSGEGGTTREGRFLVGVLTTGVGRGCDCGGSCAAAELRVERRVARIEQKPSVVASFHHASHVHPQPERHPPLLSQGETSPSSARLTSFRKLRPTARSPNQLTPVRPLRPSVPTDSPQLGSHQTTNSPGTESPSKRDSECSYARPLRPQLTRSSLLTQLPAKPL